MTTLEEIHAQFSERVRLLEMERDAKIEYFIELAKSIKDCPPEFTQAISENIDELI